MILHVDDYFGRNADVHIVIVNDKDDDVPDN